MMATGKKSDGMTGSEDGQLAQLGNRTSLLALDTLLALTPAGEKGFADAATEARILSRRVLSATRDYREAMHVDPAIRRA